MLEKGERGRIPPLRPIHLANLSSSSRSAPLSCLIVPARPASSDSGDRRRAVPLATALAPGLPHLSVEASAHALPSFARSEGLCGAAASGRWQTLPAGVLRGSLRQVTRGSGAGRIGITTVTPLPPPQPISTVNNRVSRTRYAALAPCSFIPQTPHSPTLRKA